MDLWKKLISSVLITVLAVSVITACSSRTAQETPDPKQEAASEQGAGPETEEAESASQDDGGTATGGGSPWIDSNLKNNITADMELSVKEDFHLAVNHEWLLNTEIQEGKSIAGPFLDVANETMERARALLEDESLTGHDAGLVQNFYRAYLDWEEREALGVQPMMPTIEDIRGISSISELSEFICDPLKRSMFVPAFLAVANGTDFNDSSSYITMLGNDGFTLEDAAEYQTRTEMGDRCYEAKKKLAAAMLMRAGYSEEDAAAAFESMLALEGKLAEVSLTSNEEMSPDYIKKINNVMTMSEAEALAPAFPVRAYVESYGYQDVKKLMVIQPAYIERLNELYTEENLEALKNYMLIGYVSYVADMLDREAEELAVEAGNAINGSSGRLKDEEYAFETVQSFLSVPLQKVYLAKYDAAEKKQEVTEICQKVITYYRTMLQQQDWMSEETRDQAINKLEHIRINAVYPDKWKDYSGLSLEGLSFYDCMKEISRFQTSLDCARTNQKVDKELWEVDTLDSNAYYSPSDNAINIMLGLLGSEFYREDMAVEELYAGIGCVIGHEISHAFDTNGAQYDAEGNLSDWWTEQDYEAFLKRADKLVAYYDGMTAFEGGDIIGANIQTEAIADMAGMKSILAIAKEEENFDYEMFFRHFAKVWKLVCTREYEYSCLTQDPHPLHYLRTNVTVQQFDEFYETFDVQPGDNMYLAPEDRVNVW